jgi:hypothetical protein
MKIRTNYVSNSSSASFIIYNWFDLPEDKRYYITDYDRNALEVWQKKKIKYCTDKDLYGHIQDFPFCGEEYYLNYKDNSEKKTEKYNFGFINNSCRYKFVEDKENNTCTVSTSMTNFDMEVWLRYNKVDFKELL